MRQTDLNFWYIVIPDPEAHMLLDRRDQNDVSA